MISSIRSAVSELGDLISPNAYLLKKYRLLVTMDYWYQGLLVTMDYGLLVTMDYWLLCTIGYCALMVTINNWYYGLWTTGTIESTVEYWY